MTDAFARKKEALALEKERVCAALAAYRDHYAIAQQIFDRRGYSPEAKRQLVDYFVKEYGVSVRRACRLVNISRTVYYYRPSGKKPSPELAGVPPYRPPSPNVAHPSFADTLFMLREYE